MQFGDRDNPTPPDAAPELTVVAPVYNESANLPEFHRRVSAALRSVASTYEIIFVDDGSHDDSAGVVHALREQDPGVRLLSFSRNFGHQAAITAGLDFSRGRAVIVMDSDLQHPPELIPTLVARWREGYDVVYTVRRDTDDATLFKKLTSCCFYKLLNLFSDTEIPAHGADFRLLDRKAVDAFNNLRERARFMRGLSSWVGYKSVGVPYQAARRYAGASSYGVRRMLRLAADGVTSFSAAPLYLSLYLGVFVAFAGLLYGLYVLYVRFFTDSVVPGWTSVTLLVIWSGAMQFIMIGVLGIYLAKVFEEVKQRPLYLLREAAGFEAAPVSATGPERNAAAGRVREAMAELAPARERHAKEDRRLDPDWQDRREPRADPPPYHPTSGGGRRP